MFITKIKLNLNNHLLFKHLTTLDDYHAYLQASFPAENLLNIRNRSLWRLETQNKEPDILLVSKVEPDTQVLAKYATTVEIKNYDHFIDTLNTKRIYTFKLTANPTRMINNKHTACYNNKETFDWLNSHSIKNGFKVANVSIMGKQDYFIKKYHFKIHAVTFTGFLQITDLDKFKQTLVTGLGREKAYGMGLLMVA